MIRLGQFLQRLRKYILERPLSDEDKQKEGHSCPRAEPGSTLSQLAGSRCDTESSERRLPTGASSLSSLNPELTDHASFIQPNPYALHAELTDMVSNSQQQSEAFGKLPSLPPNSTSLRHYLERTSTKPSYIQTPDNVLKHSPQTPGPSRLAGNSTHKAPHFAVISRDNEEDDEIADAAEIQEGVSIVSLVEVCESTKEVILDAMKKFGMKESKTETDWNVRWSDHGVSLQIFQKLQKYQRINRFPGSGLLMTKNNLARHATKMKITFSDDYGFVPETWCLPGEISKVEQYARNNEDDCFIVKPNDGSSGKGISLTRSIVKLKTYEKMVCQVYIRKPFLIDGYKFDLRVYALMTSCKPFRLYVYNEGLARFATAPYEEPNLQNESNRFMHLTNYAVNKRSPSYVVDESKGTLRRLTTISKWLSRHNMDAKRIWDSMDDAIVKTIISFLPDLRHNYKVSFPEQADSNSCFQILGFDIIFDQNLRPFVLEVNDSPSLKADIPLDQEMTRALMHDTFDILHLDENNRGKVLAEEKRQSRARLLSGTAQNRNDIQKEKQRRERLLTQSRTEWENTHMGNFRKVFPNDEKTKQYKKFIKAAQEIFSKHL